MTSLKTMMHAAIMMFFIHGTPTVTCAADMTEFSRLSPIGKVEVTNTVVVKGRAVVIDGRTVALPEYGMNLQLADIDVCELPQWAINPKWENRLSTKAPSPVPCGPLAKAWLKRMIGISPVKCFISSFAKGRVLRGRCDAAGRDLALEMLKAGWARVTDISADPAYLREESNAIAARYGMWATFVLDMKEWRKRAIDKTLQRQPIADYSLLLTRRSEISPPFDDLRLKPKRTDR